TGGTQIIVDLKPEFMEMELMYFGQLTDITGCSTQRLPAVADTDALRQWLYAQYPALQHAKFMIAINNKLVSGNVAIPEGARIAFMPPFSGG
ncbi:MAG: hypothetical protein RLZZ420_2375, partial [Bacteroidota bacterium]